MPHFGGGEKASVEISSDSTESLDPTGIHSALFFSSNFFAFFGKILQKFVIFEFFSSIFAQILMKFCRNFADILEDVEIFLNFLNFLENIPEF